MRGERIQGFGTIVGGGRILDPKPPRRRRADWRRTLCCPSADKVDILTREAGRNGLELSYIAQRIVGARSMNTRRFYADLVEKEQARIVSKLTKHHEAHPFAEGLAIKELVTDKLSEFIVGEAISTGAIVRSGAYLSLSSRKSRINPAVESLSKKIMRAIGRSGLTALSRNQLFERFPADRKLKEAALQYLEANERLVIVSDLCFPAREICAVRHHVAKVCESGERLPVGWLKDEFGISRKYSIPLWNWLDKCGVTRRDGDIRVAGRRVQEYVR